jgi:selenide,water dikinase
MGPDALAQVLRRVDFPVDKDKLIVGLENGDDAAVYKLNDEDYLIQTVDFFTPVVDDPYLFGQIAATNALSDIYAMGGEPILALNIVGFPSCLDNRILSTILQGGADKARESGASLVGGHTVEDDEPKYGLAVSGLVKAENLLTNSGAQAGDLLILTKEIGIGIMVSAIKAGFESSDLSNPAVKLMTQLNNNAVKHFSKYQINACTDITGFGLLGHLVELAEGSNMEVEIDTAEVPIIDKAVEYADMGMLPAGAYKNLNTFKEKVIDNGKRNQLKFEIFFDPQTSGGLLISAAEEDVSDLLIDIYGEGIDAAVIGRINKGKQGVKLNW